MKTLKELVKRADDLHREWLRKLNADWRGHSNCCTCKKDMHVSDLECGHYLSRQFLSVRYSILNTALQCHSCNFFGNGEELLFYFFLVNKYGHEAIEKMESEASKTVYNKREFLENVIAETTEKLKQLK